MIKHYQLAWSPNHIYYIYDKPATPTTNKHNHDQHTKFDLNIKHALYNIDKTFNLF